MRTKDPTEDPLENETDVCGVCARDLTDEGDCPEHGNEADWRRLAAEERASYYVKESNE
jgi:hypothetical protein